MPPETSSLGLAPLALARLALASSTTKSEHKGAKPLRWAALSASHRLSRSTAASGLSFGDNRREH